MTSFRRRLAASFVLVLAVIIGALGVAASFAGVRVTPVLTGSMAPTTPAGSLVVTTPLHARDVGVGDVIAFRPPAPYGTPDGRAYLHRVTKLEDSGALRIATTQGDANPGPDPWRLGLDADTDLGQARLTIPYLGRLLAGGPRTALPLGAGVVMLIGASALYGRRKSTPECTCDETSAAARPRRGGAHRKRPAPALPPLVVLPVQRAGELDTVMVEVAPTLVHVCGTVQGDRLQGEPMSGIRVLRRPAGPSRRSPGLTREKAPRISADV